MTLIEAVEEILNCGKSKYYLSKSLSVQPIMVDKWLRGEIKTVNVAIAETFEIVHHMKIDEEFINNMEPRQRHMYVNKNNELDY